jgi:PAS domain S-box-containing protein
MSSDHPENILSEVQPDYWGSVFESLNLGAVIVDKHNVIDEANLSFANLSGITRKELKGMKLFDFIPGVEKKEQQALLARLALEPKVTAVWTFLPTADLPSVCSVSIFPLFDPKKKIKGYCYLVQPEVSSPRDRDEILLRFDADLRIRFVSGAGKKLLGRESQSLLGVTLSELKLPSQFTQRVEAELRRSLTEQVEVEFSADLELPSQSQPLHFHLIPDHEGVPSVFCVLQFAADKNRDRLSREIRQKCMALFEELDEAFYLHTFDGEILDVNQAACDFVGYSRQELLRMNLSDLLKDLDLQQVQSIWKKVLPGKSITVYVTAQLKNGGTSPVEVHISGFLYEGEIYLLGLVRQISERALVGKERDELINRLQIATQAAHLGVWELDLQTHQVIWDEQMYKMYHFRPGTKAPDYEEWRAMMDPEDLRVSSTILKNAIENDAPYDFEFRINLPNHKIIYIKSYGKVIHDAQGKPLRLIGTNADITDSKRSQVAAQIMNETEWQIVHSTREDQIYTILGNGLQKILVSGYVAVVLLNEEAQAFQVQGSYGMGEHFDELVEAFHIDPAQINFYIDEMSDYTLAEYRSGKLERYQGGIYELASRKVPKAICQTIEKMLDIAQIYIMGFVQKEKNFGGVIISTHDDIQYLGGMIESVVNVAIQRIKRIHFENDMHESEKRFRALFEDSPVPLWEQDMSAVKARLDEYRAQGVTDFAHFFTEHPEELAHCGRLIKVLDLNKAAVTLLKGHSKKEVINHMDVVLGGESYSNFLTELVSIAQGQIRFEWEGTNFTLQGNPLILYLKWTAAPGYEDSLARVLVSTVDVTERRNAEEQLRKSEENFRQIFEESPIGIIISSPQAQFIRVNRSAAEMLGYSVSELQKTSVKEVALPEDLESIQKMIEELSSKKRKSFSLQMRFLRKDDSLLWSNLIVTAIYDAQGQVVNHLAMVEDITEKKKNEEAVQYEQYLTQTLMDHIPDSIYFKDLQSQFTRVNVATLKKFGLSSPEEILGKTDADFFIFENAEEVIAEEKEIAETGQPIISSEIFEKWKDGRPVTWSSVTKMPLYNPSGQIIGTFGVTRDITDRKAKEEEIKGLYSDLEKRVEARTKELSLRNQELESFTYTISHDLKAPLRGISGYSQLLLQDYSQQLDDEGKSFLHKLILSSQQLSQLIDDLLAYSRIERRPLNLVKFSVAAMIDAVIDERQPDFLQQHIQLEKEVEDEMIKSSPELLTEIVRNYLDNAIKFTSQSAHPVISIQYKIEKERSLLVVKDNGIGFENGYSDRLFDVFYRLHRIDEYPGTGIGLALVKKTAGKMGWRVWAEGKPGEGAAFYLEIPHIDK